MQRDNSCVCYTEGCVPAIKGIHYEMPFNYTLFFSFSSKSVPQGHTLRGAPAGILLFHNLTHRPQSVPSVAELILLLRLHLCCRTAIFGYVKDRVIAKTIVPYDLMPDDAFYSPSDSLCSPIRKDSRYGTDKSRCALLIRHMPS